MDYRNGKLIIGSHVWTLENGDGACTAICENIINDVTLIIKFFKGANIFGYTTRYTNTKNRENNQEFEDAVGIDWMARTITREEIEQVQVALVMLYCNKL